MIIIFKIMYIYIFSMSVMAESALDRLACGLGGKTMLPHILSNVSTMLTNPNWKYRYAVYNFNYIINLSYYVQFCYINYIF